MDWLPVRVYISKNRKKVFRRNEIFNGKFGKAEQILIEKFLDEEMSYFIISDGKNFKRFQTAQDHEVLGRYRKNTGGMGAYSHQN